VLRQLWIIRAARRLTGIDDVHGACDMNDGIGRVLVLGANGRLGRAAARAFAAAGWSVVAQVRRAPADPLAGGVEYLECEIADAARIVARARGAEVAAQALARGMRPLGDAVRGAPWGAFVQGFAVPTRRGRCYLVGAAGNESLPALDLWLSGPDGALLASDTNERERAVVYHCAARDAVLTANVRAHAGRGEYVVMRFEGEVAP